jgi:hypothetical protein
MCCSVSGAGDARKYTMWLRKCRAELEDAAKQTSNLHALAAAAAASSADTPSAVSGLAKGTQGVPKFQYYQTVDKITVSILQKVRACMHLLLSLFLATLRVDHSNRAHCASARVSLVLRYRQQACV